MKKIKFMAACRGENGDTQWIEVDGEPVLHGLVLHAWIRQDGTPSEGAGFAISEPTTGCRVCYGLTRDMALMHLDAMVSLKGGAEPFRALLERLVNSVSSRIVRPGVPA